MQILLNIPDTEIPIERAMDTITLFFENGHVCKCNYPFKELPKGHGDREHVNGMISVNVIANGTPLDNVRAEIESQRKEISHKYTKDDELQAYYDGLNDGLKDARDILDKYIAESEVSE